MASAVPHGLDRQHLTTTLIVLRNELPQYLGASPGPSTEGAKRKGKTGHVWLTLTDALAECFYPAGQAFQAWAKGSDSGLLFMDETHLALPQMGRFRTVKSKLFDLYHKSLIGRINSIRL